MYSAREMRGNDHRPITLAAASPLSSTDHALVTEAAHDRLASPESWSRALLDTQSEVAAAGSDLRRVIDAVVQGTLRLMPHVIGAVVELAHSDLPAYRAISGVGLNRQRMSTRSIGKLSQRCIRTGEVQYCTDTEADDSINHQACREVGIRSILVVPLPFEGLTVGVLRVFAGTTNGFDKRDLLTAQLLAGPIAIGLASAAQARALHAHDVAAKRFAATFEQAAVGIAHVAPDGGFLLVNDRFCAIAGHDRDVLLRGGFQRITHPDDLQIDLDYLARLTRGEIPNYAMEKRYIRCDGSLIWINLTVSLVRHADGSPDFFVSVIEDISARKQAEKQANQDTLTGLPNRRWLKTRLAEELRKLPSADKPLTVAYLDLDRFKSVNDRFGHAEGDKCLIEVAHVLRDGLRDSDVICRMAGDEFVLLLSGAGYRDVVDLLMRLQAAVKSLSAQTAWRIGVSAGAVIVAPGTETGIDQVLAAADRLMYGVKRKIGRKLAVRTFDSVSRKRHSALRTVLVR
jgi:diguanylate cyclase (GGDEF)-like protein/PAS domain S-box-containing protein